jgi:hypothetical protein
MFHSTYKKFNEATMDIWCKLQETVNCGKWFSMHSEFREIEGT